MSLHYLVKHEWPKNQQITTFSCQISRQMFQYLQMSFMQYDYEPRFNLSKCSKCPSLAFTQARRRSCHWRMPASIMRWSTASQAACNNAFMQFVDVADGLLIHASWTRLQNPNLIVYQMHVPANHQQHRRTAWMHCCSLGSCRPARHWRIHSPVVRVSSCFLLSLSVKEFLKSVKIWQSYCQSLGASFFWNMVYMTWSSKPFEN